MQKQETDAITIDKKEEQDETDAISINKKDKDDNDASYNNNPDLEDVIMEIEKDEDKNNIDANVIEQDGVETTGMNKDIVGDRKAVKRKKEQNSEYQQSQRKRGSSGKCQEGERIRAGRKKARVSS
ncbi:MAG: hypothetical protein EZS28_010479 [Streblomastix strix]|uniref:Uncharacterized protein n=1 Tax=Streblomastix strix TaxID=222440 RepID=A0A5J4WG58_9EUKA|nr:MAG: hypothetical protein EZS28_010479 [Streblomastix strix]